MGHELIVTVYTFSDQHGIFSPESNMYSDVLSSEQPLQIHVQTILSSPCCIFQFSQDIDTVLIISFTTVL